MYDTAVIADDFTSVTDCTIPFACRGLSTAALIAVPRGALPEARVLGVNTDSRTALPRDAYRRSREAAERLREAGVRHVYKSVDSTLRGNLGAEIDGVMDGLGFSLALVAPAFPHYGRTTAGGIHYLNGLRLEETALARDPACPARESDLARILAAQSRRRPACLGTEAVRGGPDRFLRELEALRAGGYGLVVLDAETEEDLERIARHAAGTGCLVVGSTGLARHMAGPWCEDAQPRVSPPPGTGKPVIVAAASVSPVTAAQADRLLAEGNAGRVLICPRQAAFAAADVYAAEAEAILASGRDLILQVDASPRARQASEEAARAAGLSQSAVGGRIAAAISGLARDLLRRGLSDGIIMTGGDMAQAVLRDFDCPGMELWGEVEPGIPAGRLMGPAPYRAVTKAGAFGTEDALCAARRWIRAGA